MKTVEAGRHEKRRWVYTSGERERRMAVLVSLDGREADAEKYGERQAAQQSAAVALDQRVMGPGHGGSRQQQDERVEKRKLERIKGMDGRWRPNSADRKQTRCKERPKEG